MKKFSERIGVAAIAPMLQTESMNEALRNSIWNLLIALFQNRWPEVATWIGEYVLKVPVDEIPLYESGSRRWVRDHFFKLSWYEIYDLVESVVLNHDEVDPNSDLSNESIASFFNEIFEREMSGYRFINLAIAPISNPAEAMEISGAIERTSQTGLDGAHLHLEAALSLLAKKPEPDYRNSIKEAISAVESVARVLGKENSKGLSDALDELGKKTNLHGGLQAAFNKLYGYTSSENGIRHAILDEPNVGFDEAKYMVVSCSAFVNYLITKAETAGLFKKQNQRQ